MAWSGSVLLPFPSCGCHPLWAVRTHRSRPSEPPAVRAGSCRAVRKQAEHLVSARTLSGRRAAGGVPLPEASHFLEEPAGRGGDALSSVPSRPGFRQAGRRDPLSVCAQPVGWRLLGGRGRGGGEAGGFAGSEACRLPASKLLTVTWSRGCGDSADLDVSQKRCRLARELVSLMCEAN